MSVASYSNRQDVGLYKKPSIQRRNHSGELDVFEAANYFSASNIYDHKPNKENSKTTTTGGDDKEYEAQRPAGARMSIDVPARITTTNSRLLQPTQTGRAAHGGQAANKEKMMRSKQPSSPGGRLASFLNSLFNNAAAKKKKKSALDDHHHHHQRPRLRRSSISHVDSSRSMYTASSTAGAAGFRSPPPIYMAFDASKRLQDHRRATPAPTCPPKQTEIGKNGAKLVGLLDQNKLKISNGLTAFDLNRRNSTTGLVEAEKEDDQSESKKGENIVKDCEFEKVDNTVKDFASKRLFVQDEDDGFESDTSSDLFELKLGDFSSGLPVHETTNVDQIKNSPKPSAPSK